MPRTRTTKLTFGALAASAVLASGLAIGSTGLASGDRHAQHATAAATATPSAADLRVTIDRLLGEHALLASFATQKGLSGSKDFGAIAKALDKNSVELSGAIGSIYGPTAGKAFLSQWRAHIGFFVDFTKALASNDRRGMTKAANDLNQYTKSFGTFLGTATGIPPSAVTKLLKAHVNQLATALVDYSKGKYGASYVKVQEAYHHMFMTGDALAAAIAAQKGLK